MNSTLVALPVELTNFLSTSDEATRDYGRRLAQMLPRPCLVLLSGDLGAGKTTMVKGLAEGLGVAREEDVASPSYTLIHEYHGDATSLYHIDLYRLDTTEQVGTLGLEDLLGFDLDPHAVVVIEWGAKFSTYWAQDYLEVRLDVVGDEQRRITAQWTPAATGATTA
jgi:tRNA threonylcarbamoyladenosine biosynthesis protein TsaE